MSKHLYLTRLFWDAHKGSGEACHDGVCVDLRSPPDIGIEHLRELDYLPAVRVATARASAEKARDMSIVEKGAAQQFLERLAATARACLEGK